MVKGIMGDDALSVSGYSKPDGMVQHQALPPDFLNNGWLHIVMWKRIAK
jgi:hypothetical protein